MPQVAGADPSATLRDETRRARRQEYIDAAAIVFFRCGYDSATIGEIAGILGVTKAAIYYHVESKEDLLHEIIREMHLLNVAHLEQVEASTGSAMTRLWRYFEGHAHLNLTNLEKATIVYRDLGRLSEGRLREIVELRDQTQAFVRGLLTEAVNEGTACALLDVELASIEMFTTVNAMYSWFRSTGVRRPSEAAREMADFVTSAVRCTGPDDASCARHHRRVPPSGGTPT